MLPLMGRIFDILHISSFSLLTFVSSDGSSLRADADADDTANEEMS